MIFKNKVFCSLKVFGRGLDHIDMFASVLQFYAAYNFIAFGKKVQKKGLV